MLDFILIGIIDELYRVFQQALGRSVRKERARVTHGLRCTIVVLDKHVLERELAAAVKDVTQQQDHGVLQVGNGGTAGNIGEQAQLTGIVRHAVSLLHRTILVIAGLVHKCNGLRDNVLQRVVAKRRVVGNFGKGPDNLLAHTRHGTYLANGIGIAFKGFAKQQILQHFLALAAHAIAVKHLGVLHGGDHTGTQQHRDSLGRCGAVGIEVRHGVELVDQSDNIIEGGVVNGLTQLDGTFGQVLALHFLGIELGKHLGSVRQPLVKHEVNARVLELVHVLCSKSVLL